MVKQFVDYFVSVDKMIKISIRIRKITFSITRLCIFNILCTFNPLGFKLRQSFYRIF